MKAPGKAYRKGISVMELAEVFPDETTAEKWFEDIHWLGHRVCGKCKSDNTYETKNRKPAPYRCRDCKSYFSVRTGTAMDATNLPLRKWAFAVYLYTTSLKGVSSMKLHRDLHVTQKTAWFMLHRLRTAWDEIETEEFTGPIEADETYIGGKRKNMPSAKRKQLEGRGHAGKTAVVGVKDRNTNKVLAKSVKDTSAETLKNVVQSHAVPGSVLYTDEAAGYKGLPFKHKAVKHSVGEYVRDEAHTNGIESFWAMLKRAHKGTFHKISPKHLQRYVDEFSGRHNVREADTIHQMRSVFAGMIGKRLMYSKLIEDNGLDSMAR